MISVWMFFCYISVGQCFVLRNITNITYKVEITTV